MIEFAALPMLISLAAAAIPYLLLRNRLRTKKTVYWSANRLLEQAAKSQARKMDWLRWLLLALRTLALVCLALAVANPFWKLAGSRASDPNVSANLYCFVIDCSPSMALKHGDEPNSPTRLTQAVQAVRYEVLRLNSHDLICVVTLSDSAQVRYLGDRSESGLDRALSDVTLSAMSVNATGMVTVIQQMIDQSKERSRSLQSVSLKIISDFSTHDWSTEELEQLSKQLSPREDGLSIRTEYAMVSTSGEMASVGNGALFPIRNLSLCRLSYKDTTAKESTGTLTAEVSNTGSVPTVVTTAQLWVENQLQSTQEIPALAAGESSFLEFKQNRNGDSDIKIEVRLPEDQLELDNVAFHVLDRALPAHAMLIGRDESATLGLSVAYQSLNASVGIYQTLDALGESERPRDIHLIDPAAMDAQLLHTLSQLAADGNHVFVWMGNGLPTSSIEQIDSPHIPARRYTISNWPTTDLAPIADTIPHETGTPPAAFSIPLNTFWRLDALRQGWQTILELGSGDAFAIQRTIGGGSLTWIVTPPLLAAPNDSAQLWNAMARWPSFIPIVDFLRRTAARTMNRNYVVGQDITFVALADDSLTVSRPDLTKTTQYIGQQNALAVKAEQLGWYSIESSKNLSIPAMDFASNLDCREIEFNTINLPPLLQATVSSAKDLHDYDFTKRPLFRALLVVCLIFLVIEMIVTSAAAIRRA